MISTAQKRYAQINKLSTTLLFTSVDLGIIRRTDCGKFKIRNCYPQWVCKFKVIHSNFWLIKSENCVEITGCFCYSLIVTILEASFRSYIQAEVSWRCILNDKTYLPAK